jgi:ABC-2 type transport system ATP-binding protein
LSQVFDVLRVDAVTKRYGNLTALSGVSFTIRRGEILGLIGPNGSGKTTLFECLGGVLPADGGAILRGDRQLTPAERVASVFYLPDAIVPWPTQPVRWALDFTIGFFGGRGEIRDDVVQRLGLPPLLDSAIWTLAKGQRKRVLLAIGLLMPQPVLMADEPFDGLDLRQTREVAQALRAFASAGRTLVLSIHQIIDASRVCNRFVLLSSGRVCAEGTLAELSALAAERHARIADLEDIFLALT